MYIKRTNLLNTWKSVAFSFMMKRTLSVPRKIPFQDTAADAPEYTFPRKKPNETILYVWGLGEHGALGHYTQKRRKMKARDDARFRTFCRPLRNYFGELYKVIDIAAGFGFSVFAIKSNSEKKVFGTGLNTDSQIGFHDIKENVTLSILLAPQPITLPIQKPKTTKVTGLSAGRAHLVITTNEGVFTLGNNAYGQCGRTIHDNEKYSNSNVVHHISDLDGIKIKSVECGQDHTLFLMENGAIYSCGWSADGQTGLGHNSNQGVPSRVLGDVEGENIIKISSKCDCVLALNDKGEVFGWGNSEYCQLFEEGVPYQQANRAVHLKKCHGYGKIVDIAAAGSHCIMLNENGDVFTWGYGILGQGPAATLHWKPTIIPAVFFGKNEYSPDIKVTAVYSGLHHSAAITSRGDIFIWGKNKGGCLGLGDKNDQFFPLRVSIPGVCLKLSLGVDHTLALCKTL